MKRKRLFVLLSLLLCISCAAAFASCNDSGKPTKGLSYTLNDDGESYSVTGIGTAADAKIVIPEERDGFPVTSIDDWAFAGSEITSVTIPDSVTTIGESAFYDCDSLEHVMLGNGITSINYQTFSDCDALTDITLPDSVTAIRYWAFSGCNLLRNVNIPDGVTSIGDNAFHGCTSLTSITVPDRTESIGEQAFAYCYSLTKVVLGSGVKSIKHDAFAYCDSLTNVYITDMTAWCAIEFETGFSNPLFYARKLYLNEELITDFVVPDGLRSIGRMAFICCDSMTSIILPDSLTSIDENAFDYCDSLTGVYYKGTEEQWEEISVDSWGNSCLLGATRYYYSETQPTAGNYWHYAADGVTVVLW